ncbi:hypothetical protein GNI_088670 [Gregarina niphandrodes]|uniref:Uncharacterized protein n=1 Tax=Gregarina niphandrodes TaxID=110365 RepID=A0A023B5S7_GRENI|nr:hypothetical protein GNI_088670 [Gregarina niphandrodes]EZG61427.1 hypothetical protein GNI_088670 [Gregarina niphandrodes]|eukprot:XP_011130746.1 hypothetical protein GNI_088670 [Gregarina niphandrodes]
MAGRPPLLFLPKSTPPLAPKPARAASKDSLPLLKSAPPFKSFAPPLRPPGAGLPPAVAPWADEPSLRPEVGLDLLEDDGYRAPEIPNAVFENLDIPSPRRDAATAAAAVKRGRRRVVPFTTNAGAHTHSNSDKIAQLLALLAASPSNQCPLAPLGDHAGGCGVSSVAGPLPGCNHLRALARPYIQATPPRDFTLGSRTATGAPVAPPAAVAAAFLDGGGGGAPTAVTGPVTKLQQLEAVLKRFLGSVDPSAGGNIRNLSELSEFLEMELEKAKNVRTVAQTVHDLVNQITGEHVNPQLLHLITEMLVESVVPEPQAVAPGRVEEMEDAEESNPPPKTTVAKTFRAASIDLNRRIDSMAADPETPPSGTRSPVFDESVNLNVKKKFTDAKDQMMRWAQDLKLHFQLKERRMKQEFDKTLADLRDKVDAKVSQFIPTLGLPVYLNLYSVNCTLLSMLCGDERLCGDAGGGIPLITAELTDVQRSLKDKTEAHEMTVSELKESQNRVRYLEEELETQKQLAGRAVHDSERYERQLLRERSEMTAKLKAVAAEAERFAAFKEHLVNGLQESAVQIQLLEDQTRKLKKESVDAELLKSRFHGEMTNVKDKLATLSVLVGQMKMEVDEERKLREFIEKELNVQREFLEHAETMVAESDAKALKERETSERARVAARTYKEECGKYKSLWRSVRERMMEMEECAAVVLEEREHCRTMEQALERDRKTVMEQETYVQTLVNKVKHFADLTEQMTHELSNVKDSLRKLMRDREGILNDLQEASVERDKYKLLFPEEQQKVVQRDQYLNELKQKLASLDENHRAMQDRLAQTQQNLTLSEANKEHLLGQIEQVRQEYSKRLTEDDVQEMRAELESLRQETQRFAAEKERLNAIFEEDIKRREAIHERSLQVMQEKIDFLVQREKDMPPADYLLESVNKALETQSKSRTEEMMKLANKRLQRLEETTAAHLQGPTKLVAIEGQFDLPSSGVKQAVQDALNEKLTDNPLLEETARAVKQIEQKIDEPKEYTFNADIKLD